MPRDIDEVVDGGKDGIRPRCDRGPHLGQHHIARAAFDHIRAEAALQIADLHGERGLRDRARVRSPAEMAIPGQRG